MAVGIGRVALAVVVAPVEGQKDRLLARQLGGHEDVIGIDGEVHDAAAQSCSSGSWLLSPLFILAHGVVDRLPGPGVLEFDGGDGQPVDEEHHVDRSCRDRPSE